MTPSRDSQAVQPLFFLSSIAVGERPLSPEIIRQIREQTLQESVEDLPVLELLFEETTRQPLIEVVAQLIHWIDMQGQSCRACLAWLLSEAGLEPFLREASAHASELGESLFEIAEVGAQLNLLVASRGWQRPSELLDPVNRRRLMSLSEVARLRLRLHQPKNLRFAQAIQHLDLCRRRGTL